MTDAASVFFAQYAMVALLGLQSLNVNRGHKILAVCTNFLIGIASFYLTATVGKAAADPMTPVWIGFVLAGPLGITTSMIVHPHIVRLYGRFK